jgi:hypothetical protein
MARTAECRPRQAGGIQDDGEDVSTTIADRTVSLTDVT